MPRSFLAAAACAVALSTTALAADQTVPGEGNARAVKLAAGSALVRSTERYLAEQAGRVADPAVRGATLDATTNPGTCVRHRAGLGAGERGAILQRLVDEGLVDSGYDYQGGGLEAVRRDLQVLRDHGIL